MKFQSINSLRATLTACKKEYQAAVEACAAAYLEARGEYERAEFFNFGAYELARRAENRADDECRQRTAEINRRFREAVAELEKEIREEQIRQGAGDPALFKALDSLKKSASRLFLHDLELHDKKVINGSPFGVPCESAEEQTAEAETKRLIDAVEQDLRVVFP